MAIIAAGLALRIWKNCALVFEMYGRSRILKVNGFPNLYTTSKKKYSD